VTKTSGIRKRTFVLSAKVKIMVSTFMIALARKVENRNLLSEGYVFKLKKDGLVYLHLEEVANLPNVYMTSELELKPDGE